ncbi:MAG: PH domain-containing protein [Candidatus Aenigmatarchaeota archaeon]
MIIKKGVFMPRETILSYEKIQNVYVDQDLFDRIFNLYDVHLSTIGRVLQMELHIDGISKETAERLKSFLLGRVRI